MPKEIDYTVTYPELQQCSDRDLSELMMYSGEDAKNNNNYWAECIYWMCVLEINLRMDETVEYEDFVCIGGLQDSDGSMIFFKGHIYTLYALDDVVLVFDAEMHPYVFTTREDDSLRVSRFFGLLDES